MERKTAIDAVGFTAQLKVEPETKPCVQDIFMASVDDLKGFHEAIRLVFPQAEAQLCIVYQIRNNLKYVASKNQNSLQVN